MKAYSYVLNIFGEFGPVPEGMDAASALKNKYFSQRHNEIEAKLLPMLDKFEKDSGYRPPYWKIIELTKEVVKLKAQLTEQQ